MSALPEYRPDYLLWGEQVAGRQLMLLLAARIRGGQRNLGLRHFLQTVGQNHRVSSPPKHVS